MSCMAVTMRRPRCGSSARRRQQSRREDRGAQAAGRRQAAREGLAQATARVVEAMARKGKLVRHLRGLLRHDAPL